MEEYTSDKECWCYLKLLTFILGIGMEVLHIYFEQKILNGQEFYLFLENHKHYFFHECYPKVKCCQCTGTMLPSTSKVGCLNTSQFTLLFDVSSTNGMINCQTERHIEKDLKCLCGIDAKRTNDVDCMDITLMYAIMKWCFVIKQKSTHGQPTYFEPIKNTRNLLAHIPDKRISEPDFNSKWDETENAILGIANTVGTIFAKKIKREIDKLKKAELSMEKIEEIIKSNADDIKKNLQVHFETQRKEFKRDNDEIVERVTKAMGELLLINTFGKMEFQVKSPKKLLSTYSHQEMFDAQDTKKCRVEWRLETPDTWNLKEIKETLTNLSPVSGTSFEIEFVYIGSLVIKTLVQKEVLVNQDQMQESVHSFLEKFVEVCNINTDVPTIIQVDLIIDPCEFYDKKTEAENESPNVKLMRKEQPACVYCNQILECQNCKQTPPPLETFRPVTETSSILSTDSEFDEKLEVAETLSKLSGESGFVEVLSVEETSKFSEESGVVRGLSDFQEQSTQKTNNYFKIILLIASMATMVMKRYITEKILNGKPFESFLNESTTKHSLFHCNEKKRCCACPLNIKKLTKSFNLTLRRLMKLYDYNDKNKNSFHTLYKDKKIIQVCICGYTAVKTIEVKDLDIKSSICIMNAEAPSEIGHWMKQVLNIRNEMFKNNDSQEISSGQFAAYWKTVVVSVMGISNRIGVEYAKEMRFKILKLLKYSLKVNAGFEYERLCTVYWETKRTDLEQIYKKESTKYKELRTAMYILSTNDQQKDKWKFLLPKQTVKNQSLQFEKKLNIERSRSSLAVDMSPCPSIYPAVVDCILINGLVVITDYNNRQLLIHNIDKHMNRTIQLKGQPRYLSIIRDNQIAVSYFKPVALASGKVGNIDIIDINNGLINTLENIWEAGCMTYQDELLFVIIDGRQIKVMNLTGEIVRCFPCPSLHISNIASCENLLYLTDSGINKLFCCDLFGNLKWEFKDDSLKMPSSVTLDRNHNVYVTGDRSKNVIIVYPDGNFCTELLSNDIDVLFPIIIRYDTANDNLLAYNVFCGDAFILDIKTFTGACDDNM